MLKVKIASHILAVVLFSLLFIGMTWPLILQLHTHITPGQQPAMTVPYLNLWTLAWNHHWLKGQASSYWDANHFFPHQKTLAYSEPQLGMGVLTFPVVLLGGNTVLAYNLALFLYFFGAGMAVYALCWWLFGWVDGVSPTDRCVASIIAGILYAFTPYMFREVGVLQLLAVPFPPVCLLGLHRFFYQKRLSDALLFTVGFLGCWYTCAYYGLFLSVFVFCFTVGFWHPGMFHKRNLLCGLVTVGILLGGILPLASGMHSAKIALALDWDKEIVKGLSAVFMDYFQFPSSCLLYEHILGVVSQENSLFLGGMLFCLASVGTIITFRYSAPIEIRDMSRRTLPINERNRPSLRRCGIFYLSMALVAFILSLGMALTPIHTEGLGAYRILTWLSPYNLLYKFVPGFSSIRSPYRFSIFMALFLAILAGIGMLWVCRSVRSRWRWTLILFLMSITIFELWPTPLRFVKVPGTVAEVPRIYQHVKALPSDAVLIEFPLSTSRSEQGMEVTSRYMYFSTFHWHRLVNGYSGFSPQAAFELREILARSTPRTALFALKAFGVQYVTAHWKDMTDQEKHLVRTLEATRDFRMLFHEDDQRTLYQIDNSKHEVLPSFFPSVERLTIYENNQQPGSVTLCVYYHMDENQFLLITPWKNPIECEVAWYRNFGHFAKDSKPFLVKTVPYQGSRLLHPESNAIAMEVPAPPPGKYKVTVTHNDALHSVTKRGICEISSHGFVQFRGPEP